jgi:hypothetical protein
MGYEAETVEGLRADGVVGVWEPAVPEGAPADRAPHRFGNGDPHSREQSEERVNG